MTQKERWMVRYNEVVEFIETNHRNPSRHRIEEHDMLNWLKANRKRMNAGELKPERVELFNPFFVHGKSCRNDSVKSAYHCILVFMRLLKFLSWPNKRRTSLYTKVLGL